MRYGLTVSVIKIILDVLKSFPSVEEAVIYGSRAMDTYREGSDVDLTLKGDLSYRDLLQIEGDLDNCMLPYTFDLSLYRSIENQDLLDHIEREGKTIYVKRPVREDPGSTRKKP